MSHTGRPSVKASSVPRKKHPFSGGDRSLVKPGPLPHFPVLGNDLPTPLGRGYQTHVTRGGLNTGGARREGWASLFPRHPNRARLFTKVPYSLNSGLTAQHTKELITTGNNLVPRCRQL